MIPMIKKRDGRLVEFDPQKIAHAIFKAAESVGGRDREQSDMLADKVATILEFQYSDNCVPAVEDIQDIVEKVLIKSGRAKTAKAYILYRKKREDTRDTEAFLEKIQDVVEGYVQQDNWRVKENSNAGYAVSGLQAHISGAVIAEYTLNKVYSREIADAHRNGDFHIHDLSIGTFAGYCAGWSLRKLLKEGFNGVTGRIAAAPARHFNAALGQIVNFFGTLQNEWAGAQAFSSFDTCLAPYVKMDNLDYPKVKQSMQEFVFAINQTSRWGNQVPFTNITFDWTVPEDMKDQKCIFGGEEIDVTYKELQHEMDMINRAFIEIMLKGDMEGRIFTFPIPTYNITQDFDWDTDNAKLLFEMTAKFGTPNFQNFVNSELSPSDTRSMCCRLQLDLRTLRHKTGGLFGSGEQTGSIGVVTINLPRIGFLSKSKKEFFDRLGHLMDLAKDSLEIKRKEVTRNLDNGLLPYSKRYLGDLDNHFSTIGLVGMNEAIMNFMTEDESIVSPKGREFALEVLDFMRDRLSEYQEELGSIYNLEATPAEGTSFRLAKHDRKMYPEIITQGKDVPYYTNSSQLPVDFTDDIFEALEHQDELQAKYTGGTMLHGYVGEKISDWKAAAALVKKISHNYKLPYFTISPTFSICPVHGYISGEHFTCPYDHTPDQLQEFGVEMSA
jgi:ribonucleoside-triphosphate reductase